MPANQGYAFEGVSSPGKETSVRPKKLRHASKPSFPPSTWGQQKSTGSYFDSEYNQQEGTSPILRSGAPYSATGPPAWDNRSATANFETKFDSDFTPEPQQGKSSHQRNFSMPVAHANPFDSDPVPAYGSSAAYSKQRSSSYSVNPHSPYNTSPWFPPSDPSPASSVSRGNPLAPKPAPLPARAKRIIYLHMSGGPPQHDLFDYKPKLKQLNGTPCPKEIFQGERFAFIKGHPSCWGAHTSLPSKEQRRVGERTAPAFHFDRG